MEIFLAFFNFLVIVMFICKLKDHNYFERITIFLLKMIYEIFLHVTLNLTYCLMMANCLHWCTERQGDLLFQISSLEQLQQQLQEGQSHNLPDQQHQVQHSLQERDDEQQMQQQDAFDENAEIEAGEGGQELRYRKTMNALEKAGLLDLTLKISELIKQNEALQKDIDTLEHIVETTYMVVMGNQP